MKTKQWVIIISPVYRDPKTINTTTYYPDHKETQDDFLNFLNYNFIESIWFHFTKLSPAVSVCLMSIFKRSYLFMQM